MDIQITRRDGTKEAFDADRINKSIERACEGLPDATSMVTKIATETQLTLFDGVTEKELDEATINATLQNVSEDPNYDIVAKRLLLKTAYKTVLGDYRTYTDEAVKEIHEEKFPDHIQNKVAEGLLDVKMVEKFDLDKLAKSLEPIRDELLNYAGLSTLLHRYSVKSVGESVGEVPQFTFMRVAMGMSYNEKNPTDAALGFYNKMSKLEYLPGGSTFIGSGTNKPALSNCFLVQVEDDMAHIAKTVSDVLMISKATGGLGVSMSKLRATGSPLKSSNTMSSGPTPFAKIMDTAIRAVVRGGKKKGALCFYMETWHYDFSEFIEWRHNAGDDYNRMRTANTAAWISDEFMKRVENKEMWYFFDPSEAADLIELYGNEFSKQYRVYVEKAEAGEMKMFKKMPATELFRQMLVALQGTGHPWLTWKCPSNLRALNNNTGTIHMSNLCTEIMLPQDKENIAVCNLASINLNQHINSEKKEIEWQKLESTTRMAVRHLDNLLDINELPVAEAAKSDNENRAVGLGAMGFADIVEKMGWAYDSDETYDFADKIFEFISYMAIDESAKLAEERGAYKNFSGSGWSQGKVPIDTLRRLQEDRGIKLDLDVESKHKGLDWDTLRAKVKKGMRNATLMAIAPNANIGLVGSTVPGIDARFAQVFSRNKISGKYLDINTNLVNDLKALGLWEQVRGKIIELKGDIAEIEEIPEAVRDRYKTSFTTSPHAYIEVAARAQKWIDQAMSRNMYLSTRDNDEIMDIYTKAWKKGLKTTYYLHMKPRHSAEQSTVSVNKGTSIGKGFAALRQPTVVVSEVKVAEPQMVKVEKANAVPLAVAEMEIGGEVDGVNEDPQYKNVCDSCQ